MKKNTIISLLVFLLSIALSTDIHAEIDIKSKVERYANDENIVISTFKELVDEYNANGYELYVLDLLDGYTIPNLIKKEDIVKFKQKVLSIEEISEKNYPDMFEKYDITTFKANSGNEFVFLLKSNLINVIVPDKGGNIQASVNSGKLISISDGEKIELRKGKTYEITVYKQGNKLYTKNIDLTEYDLTEYKLKNNRSIFLVMGIMLFAVAFIGIIYIVISMKRNKIHVDKQKDEDTMLNDRDEEVSITIIDEEGELPEKYDEVILIGNEIISVDILFKNNGYIDILRKNVINKLNKYSRDTDRRLDVVRGNSRDHQKHIESTYRQSRQEIYLIENEVQEIEYKIKDIQGEIRNLQEKIDSIKNIRENSRLEQIKSVVDCAHEIYLELCTCYLKLDDIKLRQSYIDGCGESIFIMPKQSYMQMVDQNSETISNLYNYIKERDNYMKNFADFMIEAMSKINKNVDALYIEVKNEVKKISDNIRRNVLSVNIAMQEFDININKTLNKKIVELNKQFNLIEKNNDRSIEKNMKTLRDSLNYDFNKAIENKLESIEEIIPQIVESISGIDINNMIIVNKYESKLSETSLGYLRTGEYLYEQYINNAKVKLDDYSNIYIMYSKLMEAELFKCLNPKSIGSKKDMSMGEIITRLKKHNDGSWGKFYESLRAYEIQSLRNHSAHNKNSGDGRITAQHVKIIREFLLDKRINSTNECWLDFIINKR